MFTKYRILIIFSFIVLSSCKEDVKTTFIDINVSTKSNNIVEVNIPKAIGNEEITNPINSEIERVVSNVLQIEKSDTIKLQSIGESINAFNQEYETFKTNFPVSSQIWEAQIDGEVLFQSSEITSISITSYINTGGAHGILHLYFLNFNNLTGNRISNENLFTDIDSFKNIAKTHFNKAIKDKEVLFDNDTFKLPENIGYTEGGLVLLYNTYEIAPYSTGIIEFTIPFSDLESHLVFNSVQ